MSRKYPHEIPPSRRQSRHPEPEDAPLRRGQLWPRLGDPEFREQIKAATVVIGADTRGTGKSSLFFGKATLERLLKAGKDLKAHVVTVPVDFTTDDVEALYASASRRKGRAATTARRRSSRTSTESPGTPRPPNRLGTGEVPGRRVQDVVPWWSRTDTVVGATQPWLINFS